MNVQCFHPLVAEWFARRFGAPTEPQTLGWPHIAAGRHTLIAAPTGSGKTLAAFLVCIDRLLRRHLEGTLADELDVLYISPLKALSNDIERNLQMPLEEIGRLTEEAGYGRLPVRAAVRTGDTPSSERQKMLRRPPHILATTPESMYLLLTSEQGRGRLRSVRTVIVDEIHALARDKRGSHLSLSLERLAEVCHEPPVRIGLSATQRPIDQIARFLVGAGNAAAARTSNAERRTSNVEQEKEQAEGREDGSSHGAAVPENAHQQSTAKLPLTPHPSPSNQLPLTTHHSPAPAPAVIDVGHIRELDLALLTPESELAAVCSHEQWEEVYQQLVALITSHRSTLVFVNTRRLAERVAHRLAELLGEEAVASHHGSLSRQLRLSAERRLKEGSLRAIVATASLEMGIDVGYIDLVCQIGSPRSIATFLQRVGRSGHSLGATPKGRLVPLTRDELLECMAMVRSVRRGELDQIEIPEQPLDILAQQIVAAVACEERGEDELFALCRRAWPYRNLDRADFDALLDMLAEGVAPRARRGAYVHRDRINGRLRARRGARLAAVTSGGAIPENAEYRVVTGDEKTFVGTVDEDFAVESLAGDVFLLGNSSWRIRAVRAGEVIVDDAHGAPPTVPFWLGEAPGRTVELSAAVSRLRSDIATAISRTSNIEHPTSNVEREETQGRTSNVERRTSNVEREEEPAEGRENGSSHGAAVLEDVHQQTAFQLPLTTHHSPDHWLQSECGASAAAAQQAIRYVQAQLEALGVVPSEREIVFERFFDESGGMQLVVHSPLGARINRAWGLALRKRFCRSFDFELQAAATDNGIVLSLSPQHSFPIDRLFSMLRTDNARHLLEQALLAVPMFQVRWRWNVTRSLAVLRMQGGKKVPPFLQRFRSDDLLAAVFPETVGCLENHSGDVEIPGHPLVRQTMHDCLHEAMDLPRWLDLLARVESGEVRLIARDTREPSPFCHELLNANPYAFLDDAPLEERRSRAVATRRTLSPDDFRDLARLDPEAIDEVRAQAWPLVREADEAHDALMSLVVLTEAEAEPWNAWLEDLAGVRRAAQITVRDQPRGRTLRFWIASERLPLVRAVFDIESVAPSIALPAAIDNKRNRSDAWVEIVRGRMAHAGPTTAEALAETVALETAHVESALEALEGEGVVMRGRYSPTAQQDSAQANSESPLEWCDRRLLARIHRLTLDGLRRRIQPVEPEVFLRFLMRHQHLVRDAVFTGPAAVREVIAQVQGFELPAGAWETRVLSARLDKYDPTWLDQLFATGELVWGRLREMKRDEADAKRMAALTRTVPLSLALRDDLPWLLASVGQVSNLTAPTVGRVSNPSLPSVSDAGSVGGAAGNVRNQSVADAGSVGGNSGNVSHLRLHSATLSVYEALAQRGALFFQQLAVATGLLPTQLEDALRELAALGLVTCDAFASIRALAGRKLTGSRTRSRWRKAADAAAKTRIGRWSCFPGDVAPPDADERTERWCRQLLARYGVVFRELLAREAAAPVWQQLVRVFRRMELRGEVRGGRFVRGVAGEQFAVESAVAALRQLRDVPAENEPWLAISAADPLNLAGIVTPGARVAATHKNSLILQGGRCIACKQAGQIDFFAEVDPATREAMLHALHLGRRDDDRPSHIRPRWTAVAADAPRYPEAEAGI